MLITISPIVICSFNMDRYIAVANDENGPEDAITELPIEENNTISLEDIQAHFPGAIALRYRHNQKWRVVRFADGIFSLPAGWDQHQYLYIVVSSHGGTYTNISWVNIDHC